jgi:predicted lipoprotein with Yx(FWY)xxD motif
MKRLVSIAAALVAAAVVLVIALSAGSSSKTPQAAAVSARPAASAVSIRSTSLGKILVDARGRTLYLFEADRPNVSTLSSAGLVAWPAFRATVTPEATSGASAAMLGTIRGTSQVTYAGHPLYYFVGDHSSGDLNGQGLNKFGALWYVVGAGGNAITTSTKPQSAPSGANNGY